MAYNSCKSVTLNSIDSRCEQSIGGIEMILIAPVDDVTKIDVDTDGNVTGITMATGKKFQQWKFRQNTGSYTSTATSDTTIGSSSVSTEVSLQFSRAEVEKRLEIQAAINTDVYVIVKDRYEGYLLIGKDNGVYISNAVMQSGTATSDLSGFTLTFTAETAEYPNFVTASVINGLI